MALNVVSALLNNLWKRLTRQGLRPTIFWIADHAVRIVTGAPLRGVSEITSQLHIGGQYRQRGWGKLRARGITAVVNMRMEFDDRVTGIAPARYLHLPTIDDKAPTLDQLRAGTAFITQEIAQGGGVYIHCGSGVGRAATLAAAYLISTGMTSGQAWLYIQEVRPFIRPTAAQFVQIDRFAAQQDASVPPDRHSRP